MENARAVDMNELALFAGGGGSLLVGKLLGWRPVCAVEIGAYARRVLLARQLDGSLPRFPIWDDVRTFDGSPWCGKIDVITGIPCQDISPAGTGEGIDGEQSSLWGEMARIIGEVRPRYALVENSSALTARGSTEFSETWSRLGTMQDGECFQLPSLEQSMYERGYAYLPTPACHNSKEGAYPSEYKRNTPTLATHAGGKINPEWTEWLMGWPVGWTDLQPLGTDGFHSWLRTHSARLKGEFNDRHSSKPSRTAPTRWLPTAYRS